MSIVEMLLISVGLAMDSFAVSICKGLSLSKLKLKQAIWIGLWFGLFQGLMPLFGYILGVSFENLITNIDHWISFILLVIIGVSMIKEAFQDEDSSSDISIKSMFFLAIATSIDAFTVGIAYSFAYDHGAYLTFTLIGIITFILSIVGAYIGHFFGSKYKKASQITGGLILTLLGFKILFKHLHILFF